MGARGDVARPTDLHPIKKKKRLPLEIENLFQNRRKAWRLPENNACAVRASLQRCLQCVTFLLIPNKSSVVWGSERKQGDGCVESIFDITLESAGATVLLNGSVREVSHH